MSRTIVLYFCFLFFFVKQKTAYEMRISDWSADVCSSDLVRRHAIGGCFRAPPAVNHPVSAIGPKIGLEPACRARIVRRQQGDGVAHLESRQIEIGRGSGRDRVCQYV